MSAVRPFAKGPFERQLFARLVDVIAILTAKTNRGNLHTEHAAEGIAHAFLVAVVWERQGNRLSPPNKGLKDQCVAARFNIIHSMIDLHASRVADEFRPDPFILWSR